MPRRASPRRTAPETLALADALHAAAVHLLRRVRREDERSGVGPARLSALSVLVFGGAMRLSDLARIEQVTPPTMTRIVAGLEREGLVRRTADAADARAVRLHPTARGSKLMHEGRQRRVARLAAHLEALSARDRQTLRDAAAIIERLHAGWDREPAG